MGSLFLFDETVLDEDGSSQTLEVVDCLSKPEIRIDETEIPPHGRTITFNDWKQFERFVEAVCDLKERLQSLHT